MYNYDELEKLYYKRKIKKYFIYLFILILLFVVSYFLYINMKFQSENKKEIKNNISKSIVKPGVNISKQVHTKIIKQETNLSKYKNNKLSLNPVIPEINMTSILLEKNTSTSTLLNNAIKNNPLEKRIKKEINKTEKKEIEPKIVIHVIEKKSSLEDLLNSYKLFPEYDTAIKIANIYFNKKNYDSCIEWAKKANSINTGDEKSWLLYAKSLVQLGKINEAKKLLNSYLQIYGSNQKVKQYLRSIK